MVSMRDSLIAKRRRLDTRVGEVRAALKNSDRIAVPDAVAGALDTLYDLWEYWEQRAGLTMAQADARVRGDVDGETAAALVHARGAKTHVHEEFGHLTPTYGDVYRSYYGVWRWQDYSDPRPRLLPAMAGTPLTWPAKRSCRRLRSPFNGWTFSLNSSDRDELAQVPSHRASVRKDVRICRKGKADVHAAGA